MFRLRGGSLGHEMFKADVLETTVQKSRHRDSEIRGQSPRALATMVGVKGQEAPVKSQG